MSESDQDGSDYEMYQGLTAEQIEISLKLELAARISSSAEDVKRILGKYSAAGIPVTNGLIRRHAKMVTVVGWAIQSYWLEELANRGEPEPFRLLCIEHGLIVDALRVPSVVLTNADVAKMVKVLRSTRTRDERNVEGLRRAYLHLKDRDGLKALLIEAIKDANVVRAEQLAKDLSVKLSLVDRKKIAVMMIKQGAVVRTAEEEALFAGYGMGVCRKRLFQSYLKKGRMSFWQLEPAATRLSLKIPIDYLERSFSVMNERAWQERMDVAEELGKRSYVWRRRLPKIVEETRELALLDGKIKAAEEYGQKCGKPLSVEELEELLHSESGRNQEKDYTRHLLALRIHERLNGPPSAATATG